MATLTVTQISIAGVVDTPAAVAAGGDVFANSGREWVEIINGDSNPTTVTFATPATVQGVAIDNPTVTVNAGARKKVGSFPPELFNNSSGQVAMTYSNSTSITVGVYKY
jgi:hypothetical protein